MSHYKNIESIKKVYKALGKHAEKVFARLLKNKYLEEWIASHRTSMVSKKILFELTRFTGG